MVRTENRISDVIWDSFNRLHEAKLSGALKSTELSELIEKIGNVFANMIKKGKVSENEIDSLESYLTGFTGDNAKNYFDYKHDNLDVATKTVLEGNDFAKQDLEERNEYAKPVLDAESYTKTFKKLGS